MFVLRLLTFAYEFEFIVLFEPLRMKIDRLSAKVGLKNESKAIVASDI